MKRLFPFFFVGLFAPLSLAENSLKVNNPQMRQQNNSIGQRYAGVLGMKCGAPLQEALALELGKHFCLQVLDPVCLFNKAKGAVASRSPTEDYLSQRIRDTGPGRSNPDIIEQTLRHLFRNATGTPDNNYILEVGQRWLAKQSGRNTEVYDTLVPNPRFPKRETGYVRFNPTIESTVNGLMAALSSASKNVSMGLIEGITTLINLDSGNSETAMDNDCPGDIPAVVGTPDCYTSYEINSRKARAIMRSANTLSVSPPQSVADAQVNCEYLNQMLYTLHSRNAVVETKLLMAAPLKGYPSCSGPGGAALHFQGKNSMGALVDSKFSFSGLNSVPRLVLEEDVAPISQVGQLSEAVHTRNVYVYKKQGPVFLEASNHPLGSTELANSVNQLNAAPVAAAYVAACCEKNSQNPQSCFDKFLEIDKLPEAPAESGDSVNAESY